ncbi:MAG: chromosomal replication initiator protein DnaA [Planctomycetota bacterium]
MKHLEPAHWRDMMSYLAEHHATLCRQWFEKLEPETLDGGLLRIRAATSIQQRYLQRQCREPFREAAQAITGALVAVEFVNPPTGKASSTNGTSTNGVSKNGEADGPLEDHTVLSPDYSFENFVRGPNNDLAYAAAKAVADQPGEAYNPLFIHGGVGLGKTHLLQAICQQVLNHNPEAQIVFVSCDAFSNQFIDCVQAGEMKAFQDRYRHVDILVIDDIHFLASRERTQEEFFHTFNFLHGLGKQIVLSSDAAPHEIPDLEERLVSRFSWGLVAGVSRPSFETRLAILQAKSELRSMGLSQEILSFIAKRVDTNARELEGAINTLQGHLQLNHAELNLDTVRKALGEPPAPRTNRVTLDRIIDAVTTFYSVKLQDLQSKRRHKSVTEPRQICMWLARKHTQFSLEEIGGYFGGRDHTTVMHSIKTVDSRSSTEDNYARIIDQLDSQIADEVFA